MRKVYAPRHLNLAKKSYMSNNIYVQVVICVAIMYIFLFMMAVMG